MAEFENEMGARVDRIEAAIVQLTEVVVLQSGRLDAIHGETRSLREEMGSLREGVSSLGGETRSLREGVSSLGGETRSLREETRAIRDEMHTMRESLTERLDRLISITTNERTVGIERLAAIEARLARLEGHVGL